MQPTINHVGHGLAVAELVDLDSTTGRNQPLGILQAIEDDKLDHLVSTGLSTDESCSFVLAPPLNETLVLSISPLLKAQHRLLSCSVLHLLSKGMVSVRICDCTISISSSLMDPSRLV